MNKQAVAEIMEETFEELRSLRNAGQSEYAHDEENSFGNLYENDLVAYTWDLRSKKIVAKSTASSSADLSYLTLQVWPPI